MITTEDDLWDALYSTLPPELGPGEKTIAMIAHEMGRDYKATKRLVAVWLENGKLVHVGIRASPFGKPADAYKVAAK
jgi:hypothetical protein